jgi:hypothetical protein
MAGSTRPCRGAAALALLAYGAWLSACADHHAKAPGEPIGLAGQSGGAGLGAGGGAGVTGPIGAEAGRSPPSIPAPPSIGPPLGCREVSHANAASVNLAVDCVECLCDLKPSATGACTGDCWRLAACVAASGCASSDTLCIRAACVTPLGGMERYMAAATLTVAVPFAMCATACFGPAQHDDWDAGR